MMAGLKDKYNPSWPAVMSADKVVCSEIVLKISHLPSNLCLLAKYSFFRLSLSREHYQLTYQPPEGVYELNNCLHYFCNFCTVLCQAQLEFLVYSITDGLLKSCLRYFCIIIRV